MDQGAPTAIAGVTSGRGRAVRSGVALVLGALLLSGCSTGAVGPGGQPVDTAATPSAVATTTPTPLAPEPAPEDPTPSPTVPPAPEPTDVATPRPTPSPEKPRALQPGDEGTAVRTVQRRLTELGYFLPEADGDFGAATQQAVWALQKAAGLDRDGLVGPATQSALDAGTRPRARSSKGRVLEVDLGRQLLLAVEDGVVTRVVNASTGNGESYVALGRQQRAYTPTGRWSVVRQVDGVHESGLELGPMYRPKYFHKGWAVHGSASIPPWPASHGCVRVSNAAMDWIWDVWGAPVGTRVLVY